LPSTAWRFAGPLDRSVKSPELSNKKIQSHTKTVYSFHIKGKKEITELNLQNAEMGEVPSALANLKRNTATAARERKKKSRISIGFACLFLFFVSFALSFSGGCDSGNQGRADVQFLIIIIIIKLILLKIRVRN
jgi:hypothetical protein